MYECCYHETNTVNINARHGMNVVTMRQITVNNNAWLFSLVMYERTATESCYHETNNCKQQCLAFQSLYV